MVDYLQQWARLQRETGGGAREFREIVTMQTERLRELARELQCTVLAISSQNRASGYGNGTTALLRAKESGDIEYGCEVLAALGDAEGKETRRPVATGHKQKYLAVVKNRQGDTGGVALDWYASRQQFTMLMHTEGADEEPLHRCAADEQRTRGVCVRGSLFPGEPPGLETTEQMC